MLEQTAKLYPPGDIWPIKIPIHFKNASRMSVRDGLWVSRGQGPDFFWVGARGPVADSGEKGENRGPDLH